MNKQFHWFADFDDLSTAVFNADSELRMGCVGCGFIRTRRLISEGRDIIISDQSHFSPKIQLIRVMTFIYIGQIGL